MCVWARLLERHEQSSNQAIRRPSNQAIKQSSHGRVCSNRMSNQAIKPPGNHAITQSSNQAMGAPARTS
eukprot:5276310-Prymnesium_polylepis.1